MHRLFFVLVALLGAEALAATDARVFRGALTGDGPVRLQRAAAWLQGDGPVAESPVEGFTKEQLQREYQRLEREKPPLGGAIALTSVGGGLLVAGLFCVVVAFSTFLYTGVRAGYAVFGWVFLVAGAALAITGGVLLAVGLVKLFSRISQRRAVQQRLDDLNLRLETLDQANPPPAPVPDEPATPAAPAQPGATFFDVRPTHVLATF